MQRTTVTHRDHPSTRPFPAAAPSTRRHASSQPYSTRSVCYPLHFQDSILPLASLSKSINPPWNLRARLPRAAAATWNLTEAPSLLSLPTSVPSPTRSADRRHPSIRLAPNGRAACRSLPAERAGSCASRTRSGWEQRPLQAARGGRLRPDAERGAALLTGPGGSSDGHKEDTPQLVSLLNEFIGF